MFLTQQGPGGLWSRRGADGEPRAASPPPSPLCISRGPRAAAPCVPGVVAPAAAPPPSPVELEVLEAPTAGAWRALHSHLPGLTGFWPRSQCRGEGAWQGSAARQIQEAEKTFILLIYFFIYIFLTLQGWGGKRGDKDKPFPLGHPGHTFGSVPPREHFGTNSPALGCEALRGRRGTNTPKSARAPSPRVRGVWRGTEPTGERLHAGAAVPCCSFALSPVGAACALGAGAGPRAPSGGSQTPARGAPGRCREGGGRNFWPGFGCSRSGFAAPRLFIPSNPIPRLAEDVSLIAGTPAGWHRRGERGCRARSSALRSPPLFTPNPGGDGSHPPSRSPRVGQTRVGGCACVFGGGRGSRCPPAPRDCGRAGNARNAGRARCPLRGPRRPPGRPLPRLSLPRSHRSPPESPGGILNPNPQGDVSPGGHRDLGTPTTPLTLGTP